MSKVDITTYLPAIKEEVEALIAPPFKVYEVFLTFGTIGQMLEEAEELVTVEDYEDAWEQVTVYVESEFDLFRKLDDLIKAGIFEPFDGPALRQAWNIVGKSLAHIAAENLE